MQSRRRRRRHQASLRSVLESDGQVSVRVIKAGGTTEGILNIKHFTLPSLGIEKSLSLYKVCTLPLLHHNLLLCRLFINTVFPPFPHISAQIMHNFSIKLLKTMSVRRGLSDFHYTIIVAKHSTITSSSQYLRKSDSSALFTLCLFFANQ